jgi:hypothetical protein
MQEMELCLMLMLAEMPTTKQSPLTPQSTNPPPHKPQNEQQNGQEMELCLMLVECCSQEKTYLKYYGFIGARFCHAQRIYRVGVVGGWRRYIYIYIYMCVYVIYI